MEQRCSLSRPCCAGPQNISTFHSSNSTICLHAASATKAVGDNIQSSHQSRCGRECHLQRAQAHDEKSTAPSKVYGPLLITTLMVLGAYRRFVISTPRLQKLSSSVVRFPQPRESYRAAFSAALMSLLDLDFHRDIQIRPLYLQAQMHQHLTSYMLCDLRRFAMWDSQATRPYALSAATNWSKAHDIGYVTLTPSKQVCSS